MFVTRAEVLIRVHGCGRGDNSNPLNDCADPMCVNISRERLLIVIRFPKGSGKELQPRLESVVGLSGHQIRQNTGCFFEGFSGQEPSLPVDGWWWLVVGTPGLCSAAPQAEARILAGKKKSYKLPPELILGFS